MALLLSSPLPAYAQKSRDESQSTMRWEHSDDGLKRRFEMRGKAEFTDDYTDIKSVSEGGWVISEEHRDSQSYRYEVRRDMAGNLTRAFYVNGAARSLDETTRAWLAKIVLDGIRQSTIDVEKRVQRILAKSGVAGVLAEIKQITGDYGKRHYYQQLIKQANLDGAGLRDVLRQVVSKTQVAITGDDNNNKLRGTKDADTINALGGNDKVSALGGRVGPSGRTAQPRRRLAQPGTDPLAGGSSLARTCPRAFAPRSARRTCCRPSPPGGAT